MEPLRLVLAAGFFALAGGAFLLFGQNPGRISVSGAVLTPMGGGYALAVKIDNPGAADRLIGVGSEAAGTVSVMGGGAADSLAIPAQSTPSLAADAAHAMLSDIIGDAGTGRLVPVTFWFERSGAISTRARVTSDVELDHSETFDVADNVPRPEIALKAERAAGGWSIRLITSSFSFTQNADDSQNWLGAGHAHLYLNGLKLRQVDETQIQLGDLPKGRHEIRATLNTSDHKVYRVNNALVAASVIIEAD